MQRTFALSVLIGKSRVSPLGIHANPAIRSVVGFRIDRTVLEMRCSPEIAGEQLRVQFI